MKRTRSIRLCGCSIIALALLFCGSAAEASGADPCSLLSAGQLAKTLGQSFGAPSRTTAPAASFDGVTGTDCTYQSSSGNPLRLFFRIYFDPSVDLAKKTSAKFRALYASTEPVTGNWDSAYFDPKHGIHVQKGKARYYLTLTPAATDAGRTEKQLTGLATLVAGQL